MSRTAGYRLDAEQRARLRACFSKGQVQLPSNQFDRLVGDIETSIDYFLAAGPEGTSRAAHDALRSLWKLAHDDDPPIGLIRARLQRLPPKAAEYIGRRAPTVISRLFRENIGTGISDLPEHAFDRFLDWGATASGRKLVTALQVLTADGASIVAGRSRAGGKRSRLKMEPMIAGTVRGGSDPKNQGGRPGESARRDLVMHLALDWLCASGSPPEPGRSDNSGFGDLVHSTFQWLDVSADPSEAAAYALRRYWSAVRKGADGRRGENF